MMWFHSHLVTVLCDDVICFFSSWLIMISNFISSICDEWIITYMHHRISVSKSDGSSTISWFNNCSTQTLLNYSIWIDSRYVIWRLRSSQWWKWIWFIFNSNESDDIDDLICSLFQLSFKRFCVGRGVCKCISITILIFKLSTSCTLNCNLFLTVVHVSVF